MLKKSFTLLALLLVTTGGFLATAEPGKARDNSHHKGWSLTEFEQRMQREADAARRERERAEVERRRAEEQRRREAEALELFNNGTGELRRRRGWRHDEL